MFITRRTARRLQMVFCSIIFMSIGTFTHAQFAGGTGTEADPYQISTCTHFSNINNELDAHYKLIQSLDCTNSGTGIIVGDSSSNYFEGVLDGSGYTISYNINTTEGSIGLFAILSGSTIKNLGLSGHVVSTDDEIGGLAGYIHRTSTIENIFGSVYISGADQVGGLVGVSAVAQIFDNITLSGTVIGGGAGGNSHVGGLVGEGLNVPSAIITITGSSFHGHVSGLGNYVGGLIGYSSTGYILDSSFSGSVAGNTQLGGLAGIAYDTEVRRSHAYVAITTGSYIGGLIGNTLGTTVIFDSFANGTIDGGSDIGLLVGSLGGAIYRSYAIGTITGSAYLGGLVGAMYNSSILSESYANVDIHSTSARVGGLVGYVQNSSINNSYALGDLYPTDSSNQVGGALGTISSSTIASIYAVGTIHGTGSNFGGLLGVNSSSTVTGSFWDVETSGYTGSDAGSGLTTEEMKTLVIYDNTGRDIAYYNTLYNNGYPYLAREQDQNSTTWQIFPYATGAGTEENPYQISTCTHFTNINENLGSYYMLTQDIDCTSVGSGIMVGAESTPFTGSFNGNNYAISFSIMSTDTDSKYGLFRAIKGGTVQNIVVSGSVTATAADQVGGIGGYIQNSSVITNISGSLTIRGKDYVGSIAGDSNDSTYSGISIISNITGGTAGMGGGGYNVGGLVGYSNNIDIYESSVQSTIYSYTDYVGGLIGRSLSSTAIYRSYAHTTIIGNYFLGGLVGGASDSSIYNSYASGTIAAERAEVGGLIGRIDGSSIVNAFATVYVTGGNYVGGLVGRNVDDDTTSTASGSFWDIDITSTNTSVLGTGLTTVAMQDYRTYQDADWDINVTSGNFNNNYLYPYLIRQVGDSTPTRYIYQPHTDIILYMNDNGAYDNNSLKHSYRIEFTNAGADIEDAVITLYGNLSHNNFTRTGNTPAISNIVTGSYIQRTGIDITDGGSGIWYFDITQDSTGSYVYTATIAGSGFTVLTPNSTSFTVNSTVTIPDNNNDNGGGGGGGGGGGSRIKDNCPNGDFTNSYYDNSCGTKSQTKETKVTTKNTISHTGQLNCPYDEYNTAYSFSYQHNITTMPSCYEADMHGYIIRKHAAKMISNYAINVLEHTPDTSKKCIFDDIDNESDEMQLYAVTACQLGLMGLNTDGSSNNFFNPNEYLNKAQLATILSRAMYGNTYNGNTDCRYCDHVDALYNAAIITITADLFDPLPRAFAMIMFHRAAK